MKRRRLRIKKWRRFSGASSRGRGTTLKEEGGGGKGRRVFRGGCEQEGLEEPRQGSTEDDVTAQDYPPREAGKRKEEKKKRKRKAKKEKRKKYENIVKGTSINMAAFRGEFPKESK